MSCLMSTLNRRFKQVQAIKKFLSARAKALDACLPANCHPDLSVLCGGCGASLYLHSAIDPKGVIRILGGKWDRTYGSTTHDNYEGTIEIDDIVTLRVVLFDAELRPQPQRLNVS